MANEVMSLQATGGFVIQPSDSANVSSDSNNLTQAGFVYLHNPAAGATVRVLPVDNLVANPITIYIPQGGVFPMPVKRIYASTPTPPVGLIGLISRTQLG